MENILETLQTIFNERHGLSSSMSSFNHALPTFDKADPLNIENWERVSRKLNDDYDLYFQRQKEGATPAQLAEHLAAIEDDKVSLEELAIAGQATLDYLYPKYPQKQEDLTQRKQRIDALQVKLAEKEKRIVSQQ